MAFDLDEEELKATRKMNKADRNEIEVNEYVRTENGIIDKVDSLCGMIENTVYLKQQSLWFYADYIANHSKQLIDLIEVGDFVNGYRVLAIKSSIYENSKRILIYRNEREKYERWIYIQEYNGRIKTQDDIVVILTKEQYMANCYKVGGENE
jgi:hypothetical protein